MSASNDKHSPPGPDLEKSPKGSSISHQENAYSAKDRDAEFGGPEARRILERKLLLKVDLRMSIMVVIYILNYIDRNNAAAARLRGFEADLGLQGQEFPTLLSILYVGYIIMQVPSNMFLNWMGKPSWYLPGCMVVWGAISCLTGITHNFVGALLTRFFLGFVEAAFFPGALFLLSKWYKRNELGLRTAILFCGNIISNAFGALMASGILSGMQGKLGHAAWRWLFYIEGAVTIAVAIIAIFILPDFPTTSTWLSPQERALAIRRMEEDAAGVGDEEETEGQSHGRGLWLAITDWRVWWMAFALTSQVVALSFNAYFPTLSQTMGFNRTVTLLLCAPPFAFSAVVAFLVSRHSDKTQERFYHLSASFAAGIVGYIIAIATMNTAARYISLFLMAQSYAGFVVLLAWISNSFPRPPSKRAVALALINAFSQLGNIAGSYVWPLRWGPSYRYSYGICIATSGISIVMCYMFRQHLLALNRKLEEEERAQGRERGFRTGIRLVPILELSMNTLGYVARQFDVLASPRPSVAPTDPNADATQLHRVNSENWSSASFLTLKPRRSQSSPSIRRPPSSNAPAPSTSASPLPEPSPPRSKQNLESVINQIFFIRVFLVVWDNLKVAWSSLVDGLDALHALTWRRAARTLGAAAAGSSSGKGKGRADQEVLELEETSSSTSISIHARYAQQESLSRSSTPILSATSRSATPMLNAKKSPFLLPKTLVLDLDETLIHSTSRPIPSQGGSSWLGLTSIGRRNKGAGHMIEVVLGGKSTLYHVYKRPFVDFFLRTVSGWYTLVIFTASMQEYADPVIDWLDAGAGILTHRFFRDLP
ncbi:hypothetical protein EST38_g566 [Candolleomyces aberdarensis]|uniref:Major facilitator superfamily (MFS) profile domain-containing protein n=1 Tax=Candolleomyces aberdarensis TaxID=2316362 RepID=A0A4Q2DX40_9AGAR|nr:hypothetical protein EST38_g566 [Candolleomyces aberdarensis]